MKVKEESEKFGLKLNIQKTKIMASGPITSWQIDGETVETVSDFTFWGSKITADGGCSYEIKRHLLLRRKVMTNLDNIFKSRNITLPTKFCLVKAMVFPVVMYGCESWTVKKAAAAATKSLHSCLTLFDPRDCSPSGSHIPGILQARTLEWVAISFSNAWKWKVKVKSLSRVWPLATQWTAAYQAPPSMGFSRQEYWSGVPLPSPEESWAPNNWCFWTVVLEKTLESPLDCKEIQPVHSKGNQSWVFIGRTDAKAENPILWPPHAKSWLIGKDSDAGRDWGQEEKGMTEDEMAGWHHQLDGHEFEWTPGVGNGQGGLVCCDSWGHKELDATEWLNWTELILKIRKELKKLYKNSISFS